MESFLQKEGWDLKLSEWLFEIEVSKTTIQGPKLWIIEHKNKKNCRH